MSPCKHRTLLLLKNNKPKLRCRHCHLVISEEELGEGYCPECYEVEHIKRYDFEKLQSKDDEKVRYRCEECGTIIEC